MKSITIKTRIENGKYASNQNRIKEVTKMYEGKEIDLTIGLHRKKRSLPQNAYYHSVVIPLIQDGIKDSWGEIHSKEQVHEMLKAQFLFEEKVNTETGEFIKVIKSTTACSTVEFMDYIEQCKQFANEWFGVIIPDAGEQLRIN